MDFLQDGFLAEAVLNFLMFLGWNPGTEKEIYSLEEFTNDFSLEKLQKTDLVAFDREKLTWYNGYYIRNMDVKMLGERLLDWAEIYSVDLGTKDRSPDYVIKVLEAVRERMINPRLTGKCSSNSREMKAV